MKNVQIILNIVLILAVGILFYFHIATEENVENGDEEVQKAALEQAENSRSGLNIRYVNTDSIWSNYSYVDEIRANLEEKQNQYKIELESKLKQFEQEVSDFQESAATMTRVEAEQKQKALMQKEQELQLLQEELRYKLVEEEDKMKRSLRSRILKYLNRYKDDNIDLILDYSETGSVLLMDDSLNITTEVLTGLNNENFKKKEVQ